ncbi:MAG: Flp pilus assembly protein CpaB [Symbiobacteriia bacterium]
MEVWVRRLREQAYLILALAAATATALFIYHYLAAADQRVSVIVAAADIAEGTQITVDMLKTASMHPTGVHPEALVQTAAVAGRFSLAPVHQGEQILMSQLSTDEGSRGFLSRLTPGERAMFLPVTLGRGLGGAVAPRDRVDVVFVANEQKLGRGGATTVLQGVRVLDVRSDRGLALQDQKGKNGSDPGFLGVLLAVSADEAEQLAFYQEHGQLYLTLGGFKAKTAARADSEPFGAFLTAPAEPVQSVTVQAAPLEGGQP